jgi:hypothetical protein
VLPAKTLRIAVGTAGATSCATEVARGATVAKRTVRSPVDGVVSVRLRGPKGSDWDLGVLDKVTQRTLNGSAGLTADELADSRVAKGQRITVQACRRSGAGGQATLRVRFTRVDFKEQGEGYTTKVVRVRVVTAAERERLASLELDGTDHPGPAWQDVILHSAADEAKLRDAGFAFSVHIADLLGQSRANRLQERRAGKSRKLKQAAAAAIPSGRTSYRTLPEIQQELKDLAAANPGFVRVFSLPLKSLEGRDIMGIEIAENVAAPPDGRPVYVQIGTHHAREWPANEATQEFGLDLINAYKSGSDPRMVSIVKNARTFVIPVMNVDGFNASIESEGLNPDGSLEDPVDSGGTSGDQSEGSGAYKRKTCSDWENKANEAIPCLARTYDAATQTAFPDRGVDPNRNYGVEWGGPGTENDVEDLTYHGPAPWSEVETESVRRFLRDMHPTLLITNHTYTGLILRPPGTEDQAPVPDEDRLRAIGDAMADQTDYISQFSYQLYDTSGTTDDYLYGALGAFSYTPEIGKVEFHPEYTTGFIPEYDGQPALDENGDPTGETLGGLREAYVLAGLSVINDKDGPASAPRLADGTTPADAGIAAKLTGTAPAGRLLRLTKETVYSTSALPDDDGVQFPVTEIREPRNTVLQVPATGTFEWTINPSTQPNRPEAAWTLTCEDGAGNVLETRQIFAARSQVVNVGLVCGAGTPTDPVSACATLPDGFAKVNVRRAANGRGLRFSFTRKEGAGTVRVTVFRASEGRRVYAKAKRVERFDDRTSGFTWKARKTLKNGVYYAQFRVVDAAGRADVRRVVIDRKGGRFAKKGTFFLADRCR